MLVKKIVITAAAGAIMLASAAGVFAADKGEHGSRNVAFDGGTVVNNHAYVQNNVLTASNTGLNYTTNSGNTTSSTTTGETEHAHGGNVTGGQASGGSYVQTGNAGASTDVTNVVNTTVVLQ